MMGGQQSSRRITIDNEEPNNVIKVSEKVVQRLKGSIEEAKTQSKPHTLSTVYIPPMPAAANEVGDNPDLREQYDEAITQNNEYWESRVQAIKESHQKINEVFDFEYEKALKDVEESFPRTAPENPVLPCQDRKAEVLSCYLKNKGRPLMCCKEVEAFSNCMVSTRIQLQAEGKLS